MMGCTAQAIYGVNSDGRMYVQPIRRTNGILQMTMPDPTNITNTVYEAVRKLFYQFWEGKPVRRAGVTISGLVDDDNYQLAMFEDQERQRALEKATDLIKDKLGARRLLALHLLVRRVKPSIELLKSGATINNGQKTRK